MTLVQPKIPFKRKVIDDHDQNSDLQIEFNYNDDNASGSEVKFEVGEIGLDLTDLDAPIPDSPEKAAPNQSYTEQFEECLSGVLDSEGFLVDESVAQTFFNLPETAKEVYIKLFNRTVRWIPMTKLETERLSLDILYSTVLELVDHGFVDITGPETYKEWELIATRPVLESICSEHGIRHKSLQKHEVANIILDNFADSAIDLVREKVGPVVKIDLEIRSLFIHYFVIYQRLTSWPVDEKFMTVSILANLKFDNSNRRSFVKLEFERCALIWPTKECFLKYLSALKLAASCDLLMQSKDRSDWSRIIDIYDAIKTDWEQDCLKAESHITGIPWFGVFTSGWVQTRILTFAYQAFFKMKQYDKSCLVLKQLLDQRLFCSSRRGRWYDEYAKILERYVDEKLAKQVCKEGLSDRFVMTGHRYSLLKRLERLCKKTNTLPAALWNLDDKQPVTQIYIKG